MTVKIERVVHGIVSLRALRVHWALHELGIRYHTEPVQSRSGQTTTANYTALNPRQKIPVFEDGTLVLTESTAIVTYLAERYGTSDSPLIPATPAGRARYFEWVSFASMELDATALYVLRRHEGLSHIYGDAPTAASAARAYFDKMIHAAAETMQIEHPYLLGDMFTGADIIMMTCLIWAARLEMTVPPPLIIYHNRLLERPAFQRACEANQTPSVAPL